MPSQKFLKNVNRRIRSVTRAMQDSCPNCMRTKGICKHCLEKLRELTMDPKRHLEAMEIEYSGAQYGK